MSDIDVRFTSEGWFVGVQAEGNYRSLTTTDPEEALRFLHTESDVTWLEADRVLAHEREGAVSYRVASISAERVRIPLANITALRRLGCDHSHPTA